MVQENDIDLAVVPIFYHDSPEPGSLEALESATMLLERSLARDVSPKQWSLACAATPSDAGSSSDDQVTIMTGNKQLSVVVPLIGVPQECEFCGEAFDSVGARTVHLRENHTTDLTCDEGTCDKRQFRLISEYSKYFIQTRCGEDARKYPCEVGGCLHAYKLKGQLSNHMQYNDSPKAGCFREGCSYSTNWPGNLDTHETFSCKYRTPEEIASLKKVRCGIAGCPATFPADHH